MLQTREIMGKRDLKRFIDMARDIYRNDENWVPPIRGNLLKTLMGKDNPLFMNGPHTFFMTFHKDRPVARILTGVNEKLNRQKNKREGYISLFESIDDERAAFSILDAAVDWLKAKGVETVVGPVSPTYGDDNRGLLVEGFEGPPVLMSSYNHPYYEGLFIKYGFQKDMDLLAYHFSPEDLEIERFETAVNYAMKKFGFRVNRFDSKNIEKELRDIKTVLDKSMPETWQHLGSFSIEEIRAEARALKLFLDEDLVYIARSQDEPIGFVVAMPDYNQVLKKINGRIFPFGIFKFLLHRKKINGMRIFMQFVVPKFRNKAVVSAIYHRLMLAGLKKGYTHAEGSAIAEINKESIRSVEGAGGKLYRRYRIYRKRIADPVS
jgi:hypothetical protein